MNQENKDALWRSFPKTFPSLRHDFLMKHRAMHIWLNCDGMVARSVPSAVVPRHGRFVVENYSNVQIVATKPASPQAH